MVNSDGQLLIARVEEAKDWFRLKTLYLPYDNQIHPVNNIDAIFSQFAPGNWLATSAINLLIASFEWDSYTLVLHSSKIDLGESPDYFRPATPRPIEDHYKRIILPSCYESHWTLFDINLKDGVVWYHNSLPSPTTPMALQNAIRSCLSDHCRGRMELLFEQGVNVDHPTSVDN